MSFPEYGSGDTSLAEPFNVSDLDVEIGATAQLRQEIFEGVKNDYCEFNVETQTIQVGSQITVTIFTMGQRVCICLLLCLQT